MKLLIPLLVRVKLKQQFNTWFHKSSPFKNKSRLIVLLFLSTIIMAFAYFSAKQGLLEFSKQEDPSFSLVDIVGVIITMIMGMLFLSNLIVALTTLYLSNSLNQIIASPIKIISFYNAKLIQILFSSSWIAIVFTCPLLFAAGEFYFANIGYYLMALIIAIPLLLIPATLALTLSVIGARFIAVHKLRFFSLVLALGLILFALVSTRNIDNKKLIENPNALYADYVKEKIVAIKPIKKISTVFVNALTKNQFSLKEVSLLCFLAFLSYILAYIVFKNLYYEGFNKAISSGSKSNIRSLESQKFLTFITPFIAQQRRAFFIKEFKLFCRDVAQSIQFLILLGLCLMYLINLRKVDLSNFEGSDFIWSQCALTILHMGMSGFIICALCTRFVYTSISLEGKSYWMIIKAPISIKNFISNKFIFWFLTINLVSLTVFISGAMALFTDPIILLLQVLFALSISFGLVGVAIGFGIFFVHFEWEHVAQLATNVGSVLYMLSSSILLVFSMIPYIVLICLYTLQKNYDFQFSDFQWGIFISLTVFLVAFINYTIARWFLKKGANFLKEVRF